MKNQEKFKKLLQDEDFVAKLLEMQTPEEVQEEFEKQGIDIKLDEVGQLGSAINYMINKGKTELTEDDLKDVSGGGWTSWVAKRLAGDSEKTGDAADMEKNIRESRAKKWGEIEVVTATALIAIPVATGISVLAKWGFDRLTKKFDEALDKK